MPFPLSASFPVRRALLGLAVTAILALPVRAQVPAPAGTPPAVDAAAAGPAERGILRIGILHPQPRLCAGQEPAQRDLRVLRLVFGLNRAPQDRLNWPWFLGPVAAEGGGRRDIALHTTELWDRPWPALLGTLGRPGPILPWQSAVLAGVPGLVPAPVATGAALRVKNADPLLPSRLAGSEWLPNYAEPGDDDLQICRHWPAGVDYRPATGGRETYTLRRARGRNGPGLVLTGYRQSASLWGDYLSGRLDAALIEGTDLGPDAAVGGQSWGVEAGTQQLVLRFQPALEKKLPPEARGILSEAINRAELAQIAPRGTFRPARAFLEPVLAGQKAMEMASFQWDSRDARQRWLETPRNLPGLKMAALAQPFLEPLAQRLVGQWEKSLALPVTAQGVEVDRLWRDWTQGDYDLMLDVVDLDDGSLQDLWSSTLGSALTADKATPSTWEDQLRASLPYLPLLTNLHWVVAHGGAPVIQQICPGCTMGAAP